MGGGTGTGAAPVIAQLAREVGALTVGVVTKPFVFEGKQRARRAEQGISQLTQHVDTLITIPNEKLMSLANDDLTFVDAFRKADEVLFSAVRGISDLITLDASSMWTSPTCARDERNGPRADGHRLRQGRRPRPAGGGAGGHLAAARRHLGQGATGVLINIVGGADMKMKENPGSGELIQEQAHEGQHHLRRQHTSRW